MSSTYSQCSNISASIHSDATADLPRICDDPGCTYPFGPSCGLCTFDLDIKDQSKRRQQPEDLVKKWVEEVLINKHITEYAGIPFLGNANEGKLRDGSVIADVFEEEKRDEAEGHVNEGEETSEIDVKSSCEPSSSGYDADIDACSSCTNPNPCIPQQAANPLWTPSSNPSIFPSTAAPNLLERLGPWLTDIFERTLAGQLKNTPFVGDADKKGTQNDCPFCGNPVGPPQLQHILNCQFAHDEKDEMEKFGREWRI